MSLTQVDIIPSQQHNPMGPFESHRFGDQFNISRKQTCVPSFIRQSLHQDDVLLILEECRIQIIEVDVTIPIAKIRPHDLVP